MIEGQKKRPSWFQWKSKRKVVTLEVRKAERSQVLQGLPYKPRQGLSLFLRERWGPMKGMDRIMIKFVIQIGASLLVKMLNWMGHWENRSLLGLFQALWWNAQLP